MSPGQAAGSKLGEFNTHAPTYPANALKIKKNKILRRAMLVYEDIEGPWWSDVKGKQTHTQSHPKIHPELSSLMVV